ncbi:MAG: hypothetical protein RR642_13455 [Solibacillus sp.]
MYILYIILGVFIINVGIITPASFLLTLTLGLVSIGFGIYKMMKMPKQIEK